MQSPSPIFSFKRGRAGISPVIATIVLIVAAIALGLLVASLAGGLCISIGRQEGFHVIDAKAYHTQANNKVCVSITFKNMGASTISGITVNIISPISGSLGVGTTTLPPGAATSASGCVAAGNVAPGSVLVVQIQGTTGTGSIIRTIVEVPVV